jgi:hypothetical protein
MHYTRTESETLGLLPFPLFKYGIGLFYKLRRSQ